MSDVREQLINLMGLSRSYQTTNGELADLILERFDVTPKPVVSVADMDRMVRYAADAPNLPAGYGGKRMLEQLDAAGLMIVRRDEVRR